MNLTFKRMAELIYIMPTISRIRLKNYRHNKNELELVKLIESEKIEDHDSSGFDPFWLY